MNDKSRPCLKFRVSTIAVLVMAGIVGQYASLFTDWQRHYAPPVTGSSQYLVYLSIVPWCALVAAISFGGRKRRLAAFAVIFAVSTVFLSQAIPVLRWATVIQKNQRLAVNFAPGSIPAMFQQSAATKELDLPEEVLTSQYVVLNFWRTWCGPCVDELPSLSRLHEVEDVTVVGLNSEPASLQEDFRGRYDVGFPLIQHHESEWPGIEQFPTSVLLNEKREVIQVWVGRIEAKEILAAMNRGNPPSS